VSLAHCWPPAAASLDRNQHETKPHSTQITTDELLAELRTFSTGNQGYHWLVADPYAGKTALAAHFVHSCPPEVDCVAYFLMRRRSDATVQRFLQVVNEQLAYLLGAQPNRLDDPDVFADLWGQAVERAEHTGRHLLLVIDGLDEDLSLRMAQPSVAGLLPTRVGEHAHVLVTSRRHPELPDDVAADHPLRATRKVDLAPSPFAAELALRARQDLASLLDRRGTETLVEDLLGLLTAAQGALSVDDLTALAKGINLGVRRRYVARLVHGEIGRILEPTGPTDAPRYSFAHSSLLEQTQTEFTGELDDYRKQLYQWAATYQKIGWPVDRTPEYLVDTYPTLLDATGDTTRLAELPDPWRIQLLRQRTGDDASAVREINLAFGRLVLAATRDLRAACLLAIRRHYLLQPLRDCPVAVVLAWGALGQLTHAEHLAEHLRDLGMTA